MAYRTLAATILGATLLGTAVPAVASSIKVEVRPDGSKWILNEAPAFRASRLSASLRELAAGSEIARLIREHAERVALEPRLVQAVIQVESGYNPRAVSNKGAKGLMQLIDATARDHGVTDVFDPGQNIRAGTTQLRRLWDSFGDLELALAAYNAGPGAVQKYDGIPPYPETRAYIAHVLHLFDGSQPMPGGEDGPLVGPRVRLSRDGANRLLITNVPGGRRP